MHRDDTFLLQAEENITTKYTKQTGDTPSPLFIKTQTTDRQFQYILQYLQGVFQKNTELMNNSITQKNDNIKLQNKQIYIKLNELDNKLVKVQD